MIVQVEQGELQGTKNTSILSGKKYFSFLGVPYAEPPVGDLRFQPPVPGQKWSGVRSAKKDGNICVQTSRNRVIGSEDCLYLNVFVPEPPTEQVEQLKPVIVFIHGGSFKNGSSSSSTLGADYLMGYDVILVTFNYRLHIFGFMNMNTPSCTGNMGLKDQVLALKWVQSNIINFGGDPNSVTLIGNSAGAGCVHLHTMSPLSENLFHRAILQSGNAACPWAYQSSPRKQGFAIGRILGFETDDPEDLVQFLMQQSVEAITHAVAKYTQQLQEVTPSNPSAVLPFVPSEELVGEDRFNPEHPMDMIRRNVATIPIITGLNDKEGIFIVGTLNEEYLKKVDSDFSILMRDHLPCQPLLLNEIASQIRQFYFKDKIINFEAIEEYINLYTNLLFLNYDTPIDYLIKSNYPAPIYEYEFAFNGRFHLSKSVVQKILKKDILGARHADELGYLFYSKETFPQPQFSQSEKSAIHNLCSLWTNFAKTGNPNPIEGYDIEWTPSTNENRCYLKISNDLKLVNGKLFADRFAFWHELMDCFELRSKFRM